MKTRKKIALIHRYGLEGWICCGGHAIPSMIEQLAESGVELHFFGPRSNEPKNEKMRTQICVHELPYCWNRANSSDKFTKTLLWYFWLPLIGLRCRMNGTQLIWNDETVPLTAPILRLFFGKRVAITVMDFFMRIYTKKHPALRWLCNGVEKMDYAAWRKLPLLFTKVEYTQTFLAEKGVPKSIMHLYRNPVDHTKFHPIDEATRKTTRAHFGFSDSDIVLTHHGILHPNKGNDWILHQLASEKIKSNLPNLKFLLIGDGPEMPHLKQLANQLDISDRIVFTGWLPSEADLNNALAAADIGLVMRIGQETDHFHMTDTLVHEMACEKPILAVDLHGIAEVIHDGENGFLFSPNHPEIFCEKLIRLATHPSLQKTLGQNALAFSQKECNIKTCATNLLSTISLNTL